jgi:hypothetical protein
VSPITLSLAYRTSIVSLPNADLLSRFQRAPGVVVQPTDKDYAVDVRAGRSGGGLTTGPLFTVTFDRCAGAAAPRGMDFACTVTNCGTISGCTCTAEVP